MNELITRRDLVGRAVQGGAVVGAGALTAACGSTGSTSKRAKSSVSTGGKPQHGGTLTVGMTGGSSSDTLDPNHPSTNPDFARIACLYDPLVWEGAAAHTYLRVAEEMVPNKAATEWTIRLRKGVLFHDGREATADDLIFSIKAQLNPKSPGTAAIVLQGADVGAIRKRDRHTITLPFSRPYATFLLALNGTSTVYLLPTDFNPKKPIGTGPFKYVSFTPGERSVFKGWEHYWQRPLPYLDELVLVDYSDESSQVNALLAGQVDCVNLLSQDVLGTVTSGGKVAVISPGGGWNPFTMRVDQPPFNDVRVRQAFRLMVDRPAMLETVFGGHGTIGNDLFGIWDPEYDHAIPQRKQDIAQAKHLLKAAGHDGLTVQLVTGDIAQGAVNMAQVFAQQAAQAGVTVQLRQITPTEYFGPNYLKWTFAQDFWYGNPYLEQVPENSIPGAPYNETHFDDPRYTALYMQARATLDEAKRTEIVHEMQEIEWHTGGYIIPFFPAVIDAYAKHVHGAVRSKCGVSFNNSDFQHLWLS